MAKKQIMILFLVFALASVILPLSSLAVSVTPGLIRMDYQPGAEFTFSYTVSNYPKIDVYIEDGDLPGAAWLEDPAPNSSGRTVLVHLTLPMTMEKPGKNGMFLVAKEVSPIPNAVNALTAIRAPIYVNVPYPGYYAEMELEVKNVNVGEPSTFKVTATNRGTNALEKVFAVIDVYEGNRKIKTLTTDSQRIESNAVAELYAGMSGEGIKAGTYKVIGTLYYDGGNTLEKERSLNVGSLFVSINNFTKTLEIGGIRRFDMEIESHWNNPIEGVYGEILFEGDVIKTPSYLLEPWQTAVLSGYIDTANQAYGKHDISLTVYYEDKTTMDTGKIDIMPPAEPAKPEEIEKPVATIQLTPVNILIAVIVLLVLFDIFWMILRNKRSAAPQAQPPAAQQTPVQPQLDNNKQDNIQKAARSKETAALQRRKK